ncbi:MAG: YihY/virulence factor BrkB family protein [Melioribacter sp.]|nr:YihY/virulence factor BrkB family protein [Melioribacter sp.]
MFKVDIKKFVCNFNLKKILNFISYYISGILKRVDEHNLFLAGAGIAYSLFLSLIPLILFIFSLLGNIFDTSTLQNIINQIIDTLIPYPDYAQYAKKIIETRLPQAIEYKNIAGYLGFFGLLLTSTWIFSSMRTILNQIYHTKISKNALIGLARDIGMVLLLVIFISVSTLIFPIINIFFEIAIKSPVLYIAKLSEVWNTFVWLASLFIMLILFFMLYYLIPYEKLPKKVAFISALSTTLLWELARKFFGYYVQNFLGKNPFYGAFVLIIVILLWVFYSSCIFILGAEIGQLYREKSRKEKE